MRRRFITSAELKVTAELDPNRHSGSAYVRWRQLPWGRRKASPGRGHRQLADEDCGSGL